MADAIDDAANSFAAARNKLKLNSGVDKGVKATKARARELVAKAPASRLKRSGRTDLWGIRCKPEIKAECRAIAKERGIQYDEWAEEVFLAAIANWKARKNANGGGANA
jgi:hypothetical protein